MTDANPEYFLNYEYCRYVYTRPDGRLVPCYGDLDDDSNIRVVHGDVGEDIWTDRDPDILPTWFAVAEHLNRIVSGLQELESC